MKIKCKVVILLAALSLTATTFAARLTVTDINKPVLVKKHTRVLTIELPSNPTTGYSWFLTKYNSNLVDPVSEKYKPTRKHVMGAGGISTWKFKLKREAFRVPLITKITLEYIRPWEVGAAKEEMKKQVITLVTQ